MKQLPFLHQYIEFQKRKRWTTETCKHGYSKIYPWHKLPTNEAKNEHQFSRLHSLVRGADYNNPVV